MTSACASGPRDPGVNDAQQDEFRVVKKAPLTVPPDYSLRPPRAGIAQPAEVDATRVQVTAFGSTVGTNASASERALVAAADANAVSPVIRAQIDYEEAGMIRKPGSFADRVLFWQGNDEERAAAQSDSATGGEQVEIQPARGSSVKLPGT
jgi:hypothetical protein